LNNIDSAQQKEPLKDTRFLALPCDKLSDNPLRLPYYNQSHLMGLSSSIGEMGLLEPVLVWEDGPGQYVILSGHYRVRAVRRLKKDTVDCQVVKCGRQTAHVVYCASNLLTRGLSAIEESHILSGLVTKEGLTMEEAGRLFGHGKSWVSRRIKLLHVLDPKLKAHLEQGILNPRVAQELTRLPQGNEQRKVFSLVRRYHLSKDETAILVDWWLNTPEEERKKVMGDGGLPLGLLPDKMGRSAHPAPIAPEVHVSSLLGHCTRALIELVDFLKTQAPPFAWWPKACYRSFTAAADRLCHIVKPGADGGGA
jgi:ParB family chromosome partitioning protein